MLFVLGAWSSDVEFRGPEARGVPSACGLTGSLYTAGLRILGNMEARYNTVSV